MSQTISTAPLGSKHPEILKNTAEESNRELRQLSRSCDQAMPSFADELARMRRILQESGGVGLAAPQVGLGRRIILVQRFDKDGRPFEFFINPEVVAASSESESDYEACLSIPEIVGKVERCKSLTVTYFNEKWEACKEEISGFTARIIQHEIDHLNGVLFIDKKTDDPLLSREEYAVIRTNRLKA